MPKKPHTQELDHHAGLRLKALREALDELRPIKQETFAAKLGVTRTALANWEAGKLPDLRAMIRLTQIFDFALEWVYLGRYGQVDYDLARRLVARAGELGAAVGAPTPEWPMQLERGAGLNAFRQPGAVPRSGRRFRILHETAPEPLLQPEKPVR